MSEATASDFVISDGPWRLNDQRRWETRILDAKGRAIARPLGQAFDGDVYLLVAAREMYDALKALDNFDVAIGGNPNAVAAYMRQREAALAKAEGK